MIVCVRTILKKGDFSIAVNTLICCSEFNAENFVYWMSPSGVEWSRSWAPEDPGARTLGWQLLIALGLGTFSSWVGYWFGSWMTKVRR